MRPAKFSFMPLYALFSNLSLQRLKASANKVHGVCRQLRSMRAIKKALHVRPLYRDMVAALAFFLNWLHS
jgi:hypothetical protein